MTTTLLSGLITASLSTLNLVINQIHNKISSQKRGFFWNKKGSRLSELSSHLHFEEIKKRVRIILVDDEDGFPLNLFQAEGYAIERWEKISATTYSKLESGFYDVIILDIKGVAQDISAEDGLAVLESIKKKNPAQIIIAYSQHSYDISKIKFFQLADENITKPSDFLKIKETLDSLIEKKFNPTRYIESLHKVLEEQGMGKKEIIRIDNSLSESIKKKNQPDWKSVFSFAKDNVEIYKQTVSLATTILKFFQ